MNGTRHYAEQGGAATLFYGSSSAAFATNIKLFWFRGFLSLSDFGVDQGWSTQTEFSRFLGDVNGDGVTDVVGIGTDGILVSLGYRPFGAHGSYFHAPTLVSDELTAGMHVSSAFADVNGDRRSDFVDFADAGVSITLGQADGAFSSRTFVLENFGVAQGWTSQELTPRLLADVNGDGRADIVGFGTAGTWVALSTGAAGANAFTQPVLGLSDFGSSQGWDSDDRYHRAMGDVNGDGFADIIGFGDEGVSVALSRGDGTFAPMTFALENFGADQGWTSQDAFTRLVGDVNKDGHADIVGFGLAGIYVALGQADGTFADAYLDNANPSGDFTAEQGWTSDNVFHRVLADVGNNGYLDIVGFGYAGMQVMGNYHGFPPG